MTHKCVVLVSLRQVTYQQCFEVLLFHMELTKREWIQTLSEYLPYMKLDSYSFELVRDVWISATPRVTSHPFIYPRVWTVLASNSLLSMMKASLASIIRLSLTYPHIPDKVQMNNHQALYLVSICLIFAFSTPLSICLLVWFVRNVALSMVVVSIKKRDFSFWKTVLIFHKICFKVKALQMIKFSGNCHIKCAELSNGELF